MLEAIKEFKEGNACTRTLENYILEKNVNEDSEYKELDKIFNYRIAFINTLRGFGSLTNNQSNLIADIFNHEMNTIQLKENSGNTIICFIVHSIFQLRKYKNNKILICSSSNYVVDNIALDLLSMNNSLSQKINILRVYANLQEFIRHKSKLRNIALHYLK